MCLHLEKGKPKKCSLCLKQMMGSFFLGVDHPSLRSGVLILGISTVHRRVVVNHCLFPGGLGVFSDNLDPAH